MLVGAVFLVAVLLRAYGLVEWSISDDEVHTLRDSLKFSWSNPRPLLYALNHYLVLPVVGLRELGLRIVPFAAGIAAIPGFYLLYRRLGRPLEAVVTVSLTAASAWHLYWSQFARYYTLTFLFTGLFGLSLLLWLDRRRVRWIVAALASGVLASLAHPSAVPVVAVGMVATAGIEIYHRGRRSRRIWLGLTLAVLGLVAIRFIPMLDAWFENAEVTCCHGGLGLIGSFVNWMTAPVLVLASFGFLEWIRSGRSREGLVIASCGILPIAGFALLANVTTVSTSYLFPAAPFFLFAAAWLIVGRRANGTRPTGLVLASAVTLAAATANLVGVASHYRDGGRLPYREATESLVELQGGSPRVVAEGPQYLTFYEPGADVAVLPYDSTDLASLISDREYDWVLAPRVSRAGFGYYQRQFGEVYDWLKIHCRLHREYGTPRLDFRENTLELYRCGDARGRRELGGTDGRPVNGTE